MKFSNSNSRIFNKFSDEMEKSIEGTTSQNTMLSEVYFLWKQFREFGVKMSYISLKFP
jgi:hypothetical protein